MNSWWWFCFVDGGRAAPGPLVMLGIFVSRFFPLFPWVAAT